MITTAELHKIMPHAGARVELFIEPLNAAMVEFEIDNPLREAAFIVQAAHESGELRYMRELASGEAYEGRKDLGNDQPGEGVTYKGRGIFQLTGDTNYRRAGRELFLDEDWFKANPALVEEPVNACRTAAWFWRVNGLNELADRGDMLLITKRINGGYTHFKERLAYYHRALEVFSK